MLYCEALLTAIHVDTVTKSVLSHQFLYFSDRRSIVDFVVHLFVKSPDIHLEVCYEVTVLSWAGANHAFFVDGRVAVADSALFDFKY